MSYETVIGLEIHAELHTKTKIFCSCPTKFGARPNENTCPICLGLPGTLPVLNEEVVNLAIKAGTALNCKINKLNKMDRKNYFYPDLPKAYQTSQYDLPICSDGYVEIEVGDGDGAGDGDGKGDGKGNTRKIRLNRIHIEEDAGKLIHLEDEPFSLIDYNRVGVPLIEIVTEPDIRSIEEAVTFVKVLKSILEYSEISDCRMEEGSLRCDANISLRKVGQETLNTRVELKNINSFKELQKALEKEQKRQNELYSFGEEHKIVQETRRWDSAKGKTVSMRSKEEAHDYRYFPEPDLLPIIISEEQINSIKNTLPEMPTEKKTRLINEYGLTEYEVDIIVDDRALSLYYEAVVKAGATPKTAVNWVLGDLLRLLKEKNMNSDGIPVKPESMYEVLALIEIGEISNTAGKEVFEEMFNTGGSAAEIVSEKGLKQISDAAAIEKIVQQILDSNPKSIEDYKAGKAQAAGFLMGQVMKASKGKVNPQAAKQLLDLKLAHL